MSHPGQPQFNYAPPYRQPNPYASYPPPPQVPVFQVTAMRHTGALIFWFNQRRTSTGTYQQCDDELRAAQTHNLLGGWWSIASILLFNWIALAYNAKARRKLEDDAQQAQAYAQWWYTYIGHGRMH